MSKEFINAVVNAARHSRLTYDQFIRLTAIARKKLGLHRTNRGKRLPHLLSSDSIKRFYQTIDSAADLQHQIMLRLLFYTGIRVAELTSIKVEDVDIGQSKVFIERGKGDKDRYVLFPERFKLALQAHLRANPENRYLFESTRRGKFSARRIQEIVKEYAEKAEMPVKVHPHLFRHQLLTWLTRNGLSDAEIQLISGHASKKSLEVYQHIGLGDVEEKYQEAMRKVEI